MAERADASPVSDRAPGRGALPPLHRSLPRPGGGTARAFVSHARSRGAGLGLQARAASTGGLLLASREAIALADACAAARGEATGWLAGATALDWSQPMDLPGSALGARVAIEPSGYCRGSAQLVVDHHGGRFVYTAEHSPRAARTRPRGKPIACDALLVDATFGLPIFRFPERDPTVAQILQHGRERVAAGEVAVLVVQGIADAVELAQGLVLAGLPVVAEASVWEMAAAYESLGVVVGVADGRLGRFVRDEKSKTPRVVVATVAEQRAVRGIRNANVAFVSGLALLDAATEQRRADAAFVLSQQADYDDLLATVRATGARHVTAVRGQASPFAMILRGLGIAAVSLEAAASEAAVGLDSGTSGAP